MKLRELIIVFFLTATIYSFGQDTIKIEPSILYSSKEFPDRSKDFAFKAEFAREDIVFSETKKRIEYCYYYDGERNCFGESYEIINDSIIQIKSQFTDSISEIWKYKIMEYNNFMVQRRYDVFIETGIVNSLIPFSRIGKFITQVKEGSDTLWVTDYTNYNFQGPYRRKPMYYFPKAKIVGKIYQDTEVDKLPTTPSGDSIFKIMLERKDYCTGEPMTAIRTISFIVT